MVRGQWRILRDEENLGFFYSVYCLIVYMVKAYVKYLK